MRRVPNMATRPRDLVDAAASAILADDDETLVSGHLLAEALVEAAGQKVHVKWRWR